MEDNVFLRLQNEMKECMKAGNKERLNVIRMLIAEIKNAMLNIPGGREKHWTNEEYQQIIANYQKVLMKSLADYPADRQEQIKKEIAIIEEFLPKKLTESELRDLIQAELKTTSERNFGALMKLIQSKVAGRADGRMVSETLKACLAQENTPHT